MRFDAVFFDSGGTIWLSPEPGSVPPGTSLEEVHNRRSVRLACALTGLGYDADPERVAATLPELEPICPSRVGPRYTYADLMAALGEGLGLALRAEELLMLADAYVGPRYRSWLSPGTEETLQALTDAGLHVGLISNTYIPGCCADRLLAAVGLLGFFRTRVYSGDEGASKPDVRIFRLAEQRSGYSGRRVLYVGDKPVNDVQAARAAGWSAAMTRTSAPDSGGLADFEFDRMPELLGFVLG